jgi:hypothetical protein
LQETAKKNSLVLETIELVQITANFIRFSGKRRQLFDAICKDLSTSVDTDDNFSKIKTICPTR